MISNYRKQKTTFAKNRDLPRSRSRDLTERFIVFIFEAHALQPISRPRGALDTWNMEHGGPTHRSQSLGHGGCTRHMEHGEGEIGSEWGPHAPQPVSRPRGGLHAITSPTQPEYIGASRPTNNTGELCGVQECVVHCVVHSSEESMNTSNPRQDWPLLVLYFFPGRTVARIECCTD